MMLQLLLYSLLFISLITLSNACPQFLSKFCHCEDLNNGVRLDCSNVDAKNTMQLIRSNQASLGLIQELILQNVNIKQIPANYFTGLYIKKLDLSHNHLEEIDPNGFLGLNNVLQELILNHNNLSSIPVAAITPLNALHTLNLSNNTLTDLVSTNALPPLPKLYDLNLADNTICDVHKSIFDHVKNSLQTLNFGRNCLNDVPASAIRGFKKLMALHLHGNDITVLNPLSFMNLPSLNLLNLASNRITIIHRQAFLNVPRLRYLYLTGNRITEVYPHQFSSFEQLEMLDFSENFLLEIVTDAFSNLQNLRQLYLAENRISTIQPNSFANSSVVILSLSSNRLTELKEGMFEGMPKVQQISLKDNNIYSIEQNVFYNCPSLVMIDLSGNNLTEVAPTTFLTQINILLIDLSKNKISRTPYDAFNRKTKTVLLQENPLVCTEKIHMLQDGVGVYIPNSDDAICGPKEPAKILPAANADDRKEVLQLAEEELKLLATTATAPNIKQDNEKPTIHPPIIKPLSSIGNKYVTENIAMTDNDGKILIHPLNESTSAQSTWHETNVYNEKIVKENPRWTQNTGAVSSRSRGNFGFNKPRGYTPTTIQNNETPEAREILNSHENPFDNVNKIYPLPIPFLNSPTPLAAAFATSTPSTTTTTTTVATTVIAITIVTTQTPPQTLPPNIVVAQATYEPTEPNIAANGKRIEKLELEADTANSKKADDIQSPHMAYENETYGRQEKIAAPTIIMIVCLSTVAIVMSAVFVGLCVAKHRSMRLYADSTSSSAAAARTSAYVAAQAMQAAQMNMLYGTVHRNRSGSSLTYVDDNHAWIYAPGTYSQTCYK